jgi:AbrB family looped-hinge helix DNA binding protein
MTTAAVKITRKGQVTIPKVIRDRLKARAVYFEIVDDEIVVRGVKDAAGSLSEYAKNVKTGTSMKKIKETAWEEAVREKARKKPA